MSINKIAEGRGFSATQKAWRFIGDHRSWAQGLTIASVASSISDVLSLETRRSK
jgi:hypothetical protein